MIYSTHTTRTIGEPHIGLWHSRYHTLLRGELGIVFGLLVLWK